MTNTFSADYGLDMGSQMTIVTKSGTNPLHGDPFEYLRNSVLDARNSLRCSILASAHRSRTEVALLRPSAEISSTAS